MNYCTSEKYFEIFTDSLISSFDKNKIFLKSELLKGNTLISSSIHYFTEVKKLNLLKPELELEYEKYTEGWILSLSTNKLAKNVYLKSDINGFFSDNYFDLIPGEIKNIEFNTDIKDSKPVISIKTIFDTYN